MAIKTEIKSIGTLGIFTLLSRILGLVRDILLAILFGVSFLLDAFVIAFTIPNLFRRLFGEGALTAVLTPALQKIIKEEGTEKAQNFAAQAYRYLVLLLALCCFVGILFCVSIDYFFSFSDKMSTILKLTSIMLPYVVLICSVAFFASILNALHHFILPSLAPIILNVVWIITLGILLLQHVKPEISVYIISFAILFAGFLQILLLIPILQQKKMLPFCYSSDGNQQYRSLFYNFMQSSIGIMIVQVNVLVDRIIAWGCIDGNGAVTVLYIGNRLMQFPLAIIGISIATVIFPLFTKHILNKDMENLNTSLAKSLHWTFFLSFPASVGLWFISEPLVALFFKYKSFGDTETMRTATIVSVYGAAIWIFCLQHVINKVFYALEDVKTPMKISCISITLNVVLNLSFVYYIAEIGLAIATVCSAFFALLIAFYYLQQKLPFKIKIHSVFIAKVLFSCLVMFIAIFYAQTFIDEGNTIVHKFVSCFGPIGIAIPTYFITNWILQTR